ncbi:MAG TPA: biotin/lipoyl-containing protein [Armatimonadota bacterium]|jgi:acetyl-CoA carboxylase biotin carboxyl carrier protein
MAEDTAKPNVEKIRALIALMEKRNLSRLVLTEDGVTVRLETAPRTVAAAPAPVLTAEHDTGEFAPPVVPASPPLPPEPEGTPLLSPTTGTFYRAPAPGEPPFVDVGDIVEVGQTVGIIMAMKVMSELPAEIAGEVVAIPAADAELVHAGTVLVVIRPL